jgi:hypothetical protein
LQEKVEGALKSLPIPMAPAASGSREEQRLKQIVPVAEPLAIASSARHRYPGLYAADGFSSSMVRLEENR